MKKSIIELIFFFAFLPIAYAVSDFNEVNEKFTYKGQPIHPFFIKKFSNWISDHRPPMVVTQDVVAAFDTNEYQNDIVRKLENGWWFAESGKDASEYESFEYKWHGKMANGVHVVEVGANQGGSGIFKNLLFLKVTEGVIFWEDKQVSQILLKIVKTFSLGDRYDGDIFVYPHKVVVHKSKNRFGGGAIDHDTELKFP